MDIGGGRRKAAAGSMGWQEGLKRKLAIERYLAILQMGLSAKRNKQKDGSIIRY